MPITAIAFQPHEQGTIGELNVMSKRSHIYVAESGINEIGTVTTNRPAMTPSGLLEPTRWERIL
jgi:hypothetical protein